MEQSISKDGHPSTIITNETDKGLDDQSFFDALGQEPKKHKLPTDFILQRMMEVK